MHVNRITAVAVSVLAGSLALGAAGIASADHGPAHEAGPAPAPAPAQQKLARQAETLQDTAAVSDAVGRVLTDVAQAKDAKIAPAKAQKHAHRIAKAIRELRTSVAPQAAKARPLPAAELTTKAAADLQAKSAELLKASAAGDARKTRTAAERTLASTVNVIAAATTNSKFPAADLKDLQKKPKKPQNAQKPNKPADQQKPQKPGEQQKPNKPADQQKPQKPADQQKPNKPADQQKPNKHQDAQKPQEAAKPQAPQNPQTPQTAQKPQGQQNQQAPASPVTPAEGR